MLDILEITAPIDTEWKMPPFQTEIITREADSERMMEVLSEIAQLTQTLEGVNPILTNVGQDILNRGGSIFLFTRDCGPEILGFTVVDPLGECCVEKNKMAEVLFLRGGYLPEESGNNELTTFMLNKVMSMYKKEYFALDTIFQREARLAVSCGFKQIKDMSPVSIKIFLKYFKENSKKAVLGMFPNKHNHNGNYFVLLRAPIYID